MNRLPRNIARSRPMLGLLSIIVLLGFGLNSCSYRSDSNSSELETLALAVDNFRINFRDFPPIVVTDPDDAPLHSWRVLILPMVEANGFYPDYDFDSAWNSEKNVDLRDGTRQTDDSKFPNPADVGQVYMSKDAPRILETIFVALARGPLREKAFEHNNQTPQVGHYLAPDQPFVILEVKSSGIHWMEPRDVKLQLESFPDWNDVGDIRDQIVRSVEILRTIDSNGDWRVRDREETLAYLDSLRERP